MPMYYTDNFSTKKWKISDKKTNKQKTDIFFMFLLKT